MKSRSLQVGPTLPGALICIWSTHQLVSGYSSWQEPTMNKMFPLGSPNSRLVGLWMLARAMVSTRDPPKDSDGPAPCRVTKRFPLTSVRIPSMSTATELSIAAKSAKRYLFIMNPPPGLVHVIDSDALEVGGSPSVVGFGDI